MLEARMSPAVPAVTSSWDGLCRLCARRRGDICVFSQLRGDTSLSQQAMLVASLKIVPEDGLPHVVCHACAARLSRCFMFRQRARRAQRRLRARSTHAADTAPGCEPESDGGNSYTQNAPAGDCDFSDEDHEPSENTRTDTHSCSKSKPEDRDCPTDKYIPGNDSNRLGISDHGCSNSGSKNKFNNINGKNNKVGRSENYNSRSENSNKNDRSCPESSHKNNKSCSDSRNEKRKVNKSNSSESNSKKSKRKDLNSEPKCDPKLSNKMKDEINKSVLKEFLENDVNELLIDQKHNCKSDSTKNGTNYVASNILFNALQKHDGCETGAKECKTEQNAIDETLCNNRICELDTHDNDEFHIDIDVKGICSLVMSRKGKNNDVKGFVKSTTKETGEFNIRGDELSHGEVVIGCNELVRNADEVKAARSFDEIGDSDGAVIGDQAVSWCESDEEKLLHTALKMSIVRHSQDWEIKRETDGCDTDLIEDSMLPLNAITGNATHLKLKVRDDLYADSPGAPVSADLISEEKKKSYQCQLCSASFSAKSLLRRHLSTCWPQNGEGNGQGTKLGTNKQQEDSGVTLPCDSRRGARRGMQKKDKTKRKKERKCKLCGDIFSGRYQLMLHRRSPCSRPPRASSVPLAASLREHMCDVCGRTFKQRTVLLQHMSTHSGLKLFTCPLCPKTFTRGAHVHVHMRIHNNVKPFVCETCGRSFTKSSDLLRHRRVHSDARDFPCPLCHKAFKRSGDVASHMRSHTGQRPYKCEPCSKSYTNHSSLLKHRRNNCSLKRAPELGGDKKPPPLQTGESKAASLQQVADVKPSSPESLLSN